MKKKKNEANDIRQRILDEACKRPEDMDMALILEGLDSIEPFEPKADAERARDAFADFLNRYDLASTDRHIHQRRRRIHLVAAVILLLGMITGVCCALSFKTWNMTALWDKETLNVLLDPVDDSETSYLRSTTSQTSDDVWGAEVYEMMQTHGLSVILPSWKPEGFEYCEGNYVVQTNGSIHIIANYQNENGEYLNLAIRELITNKIPDYHLIVEADESVQETIEWKDTEYYISSNLENMSVSWIDNDISVQLSGNIDRSDIETMIKSMEAVTNEQN